MSKGTVLYIGGFELPDRNAAAHRVINNARAFKELGYNVIFAGVDKEISANIQEPHSIFGFESFPLMYPSTTKQWAKQMVDISHYEKVLERYDDVKYIICYNLHAVPLFKVLKLARKKGIKVLADCTEWYDNKPSLNPVAFIKYIDTQCCMRWLQKKCYGMIAISTYLEGYYKPYIKNMVVVPPLVDVTEEKWHQVSRYSEAELTFVYSGQPGDTKDKIGEIISAFLSVENTHSFCFRVVGLTEEEFFATYPHLIKKKKEINKFAQFCGRVSHSTSIQELKSADYCIFIRDRSRKNMAGFPTKFVECYTSGVNIIANNVSDIKSYFPQDKYSIMIAQSSGDDVAYAIKEALSKGKPDKQERNENPFDYHKWVDVFNQIIKESTEG